jgi:predicted DNA-binding transcriptional regulator YafY
MAGGRWVGVPPSTWQRIHGTMAKKRTDADRRARQCDRLARLFRVLQIILGPGQHDAKTIAQELECSERTVFRDLQALSVAGVPWYFDESCQSYRVRPGFRFSALPCDHQAPTDQSSSDAASASTPKELTDLSIEAVRQLAAGLGQLEEILVRLRTSLGD